MNDTKLTNIIRDSLNKAIKEYPDTQPKMLYKAFLNYILVSHSQLFKEWMNEMGLTFK